MTITVKARFANGLLTPLEPLDLEEGQEVVISIEAEPALGPSADSVLEMFERLHDRPRREPGTGCRRTAPGMLTTTFTARGGGLGQTGGR